MGSLVKPKETLAICGFTILAVGLSCLGYVQWLWFRAIRLDNHFQYLAGGPCTHPLKHVDIPRRVISENDSESILIVLSNKYATHVRQRCTPPHADVARLHYLPDGEDPDQGALIRPWSARRRSSRPSQFAPLCIAAAATTAPLTFEFSFECHGKQKRARL